VQKPFVADMSGQITWNTLSRIRIATRLSVVMTMVGEKIMVAPVEGSPT
jgi:hypothetical protein